MRDWLDAHKPSASARWHLLLAALMWTVVGGLLLFFGVRWVSGQPGAHAWLILLVAMTVGLLKARFVLHRTAARMIERIRTRGDGRCLGGFLSLRTWGFVVVMIGAGRLLRGGSLPRTVAGFVYVAVGVALLVASYRLWRAWYDHDGGT